MNQKLEDLSRKSLWGAEELAELVIAPATLHVDYPSLAQTIRSLTHGETDVVALMATLVCELHHADDRFDWTGFYRVTEPEVLKIGPYQGGHGCLVIPFARGVCGAAARTRQTQLVPDVDAFPGHIACASSTRSELVIPVFGPGEVLLGVLDIDSNQPDAFTQEDADKLQEILDDTFGRH
ncbi:GAF domain-containing protein [Paracoccus laeviglucosivorans]|uniref:GAF domain-containing protein n=1 Tax=Paracoccus laeviglucosivorans TaxID=1197861 RepID=A0A521DL42_9RHOB|nr:GAF domain-containing protein [Paracoccus laeviglucosivorans]SMO72315.1 GAF domain-containing protein [Paracoccus laeviglucosivorans]